jgi:hypothetical protein
MTRWLYFVHRDEKYDWVDGDLLHAAADAWGRGLLHPEGIAPANARPGWGTSITSEQDDAIAAASIMIPTDSDRTEWERSVYAMRDISRRALGYRPSKSVARNRPARIDPREADQVVAKHVSLLRPRLRTNGKPLRTLDRLVLDPAVPGREVTYAEGARVFWQIVFASMLPGFGVAVCCDCGKPLPDSQTGRRSRAERCRSCRQKNWLSQLPIEDRRKLEREKKRRQREGG